MTFSGVEKTFSRLTQRAGELVNIGTKTEHPAETIDLLKNIDSMKTWLNQLISATEGFVDISIATKVIATFQKNKETTTTTDKLGAAMETIATQCESTAPALATALKNTARLHHDMADARKGFNDQTNKTFIEDLKNFMSNEWDKAHKTRFELDNARLDLDTCKNKLKNAKSAELKATLEIELKTEEAKYNKIYNDALAVFKNTVKVFDELSVQLRDLVQSEKDYYQNCSTLCQAFLDKY